jgi:hypothetical protein
MKLHDATYQKAVIFRSEKIISETLYTESSNFLRRYIASGVQAVRLKLKNQLTYQSGYQR